MAIALSRVHTQRHLAASKDLIENMAMSHMHNRPVNQPTTHLRGLQQHRWAIHSDVSTRLKRRSVLRHRAEIRREQDRDVWAHRASHKLNLAAKYMER